MNKNIFIFFLSRSNFRFDLKNFILSVKIMYLVLMIILFGKLLFKVWIISLY